jgi:AraC family transcriptional regulator
VGFKGHILREQVTTAFQVTETVFAPDEKLSSHEHAKTYVSFLLAGAYVERTRTAEQVCSMGTVIWHCAGETHSDQFYKQGGHLLNLEFRDDWLRSVRADVEVVDEPRFSCGGPSYSLGLNLYHFLNTGHEVPEDLATELVGFYKRGSDNPGRPEWLRRVLQFIHDAYSENLTLATAAKIAGVHPVHVSRSFRRLLGCTFIEYVGQVRLRRVFDLLRGSTMPMVDVALECGYADHSHMSRSFKRSTGITPSTYRSYLLG